MSSLEKDIQRGTATENDIVLGLQQKQEVLSHSVIILCGLNCMVILLFLECAGISLVVQYSHGCVVVISVMFSFH